MFLSMKWPLISSHIQVETIQQVTKEDPTLQLLMQQLMKGWPDHVKQVPETSNHAGNWEMICLLNMDVSYFKVGSIYLKLLGHIISKTLQGHPGITRMRVRAQTSMYWIVIGKQLEGHELHCVSCQVHSRSQQKEQAIPVKVPGRPWEKLSTDLFFQGSHWYVVIADYYSKYPWIKKLEAISSKEVPSAYSLFFRVWDSWRGHQ